MAKAPRARVTDIELAKAIIAHEGNDCFRGIETKQGPQPNKLVSCTGGVFWGRRGDTWPRNAEGTPLFPWLQVVCSEMKGLYGAFYKKQAVCYYLAPGFFEAEEVSTLDGSDFVVREYEVNDKLAPLERPKELKGHPFRHLKWEKRRDYPSLIDPQVEKARCTVVSRGGHAYSWS